MAEKNYAEQRASVLESFDEFEWMSMEKRIGYLIPTEIRLI